MNSKIMYLKYLKRSEKHHLLSKKLKKKNVKKMIFKEVLSFFSEVFLNE